MKAIDILVRIDRHDHGFFVQTLGQRQLYQDSVNGLIGVQPFDQRDQVGLRDIGRQPVFETFHVGGDGRLVLGRNIDLAGGVFTDQHHGQTGCATDLLEKGGNRVLDTVAKTGGKRLAVDDLGCGQPRSAWASGGRIASCRMMMPMITTIGVRSIAPKSGMILRIGR